MLTLELRKLEDAGIVERTEFGGYSLRVEYQLTPAGHRLVPLIDALGEWWEATSDPGAQSSSADAELVIPNTVSRD